MQIVSDESENGKLFKFFPHESFSQTYCQKLSKKQKRERVPRSHQVQKPNCIIDFFVSLQYIIIYYMWQDLSLTFLIETYR